MEIWNKVFLLLSRWQILKSGLITHLGILLANLKLADTTNTCYGIFCARLGSTECTTLCDLRENRCKQNTETAVQQLALNLSHAVILHVAVIIFPAGLPNEWELALTLDIHQCHVLAVVWFLRTWETSLAAQVLFQIKVYIWPSKAQMPHVFLPCPFYEGGIQR